MTRENILLVEDDEVFARVVSRAFEQRNYAVSHAHNSAQAQQLINSEMFSYAILDLNLGGETSLSLIHPIKQKFAEIRILILTGYASIATAVEAIKLGADNYLAKPADADEILLAMLVENASVVSQTTDKTQLEPMSVRRLEWEHIQRVLMQNDGNISATARQLNMHRRTLQRKLQKKPVSK